MSCANDALPDLLPCSICSRTFKPESLAKHTKVCEKQLTKRRKIFDSSKQRIQGTELAEFLPTIIHEKKNEKVTIKKQESKWKEKHLEFVRAIRAARGVESESTRSSALQPSRSSNHEKCPHCDRNFGPKAFDRHIEWCKEQKARIPKSPASLQAKERLEARTKYRAPPLAKSKRTLTREKYARVSQHSSQELSPMGSRSATAFSKPSPTQPQDVKIVEASSKLQGAGNKPKVSTSSSSCVLPSGTSQMKRREPSASPSRRLVRSGSKTPKKGTVKNKKEETNNSDSLFTSSCNITKLQPSKERLKGKEGKINPMENSSSEEVYDPYVSAEKQMMELLSQGDFVHQPHHQKSTHSSQAETSTVFPSFESSHRSAFVRYSPQDLTHLSNETIIPSSLIAEFEDLFIAGCQKSNYVVDNSAITDEPNQNIPITLSSIGLNLTNNNVEIAQTNRKPSKIRAKMESAALSLQRSVSLMNYENDMKVGTEASNLIQSDEDSNPLPVLSEFPSFPFSSPVTPHAFPSSKSHLQKGDADKKAVEDRFELKSNHSVGSEFFAQPKCHSAGGKFSADSAYGSLTRRSPTFSVSKIPVKNEIDIGDGERLCFMSSSSSESSLPPLCTVQVVKHEGSNPSPSQTSSPAMDASPVSQSVPRMSKFCHECGYKYPVSLAKFCCECGVRRLAM